MDCFHKNKQKHEYNPVYIIYRYTGKHEINELSPRLCNGSCGRSWIRSSSSQTDDFNNLYVLLPDWRMMCLSGATSLPVDICFLVFYKGPRLAHHTEHNAHQRKDRKSMEI